MWHEARRQERKIRGMLVDYRRRAERRRDFYEKIKADPTQFLQIHGRQCKIHLDPSIAAAAESASTMMPWQGNADNLIDRFDVRAHLDHIPIVTKQEDEEPNHEERQMNYERYRIIAQNAFLTINEEKFLKQLHLEEQFGYTDIKSKKDQPRPSGGATIGFNYEDGTGIAPSENPNEEESEENNSDSDLDVDLSINVSKMDPAQAHEMNRHGRNFGMSSNDFYSFLTHDLEEAETFRLAKEEEHEKALFSGRKSRRERRAHREKRLANRVISPPSYAARTSPTYPSFRDSKSPSKSPSPENTGKITYITSFGDEDDSPATSKPAKTKNRRSSDRTVYVSRRDRSRERSRRKRSRTRSRSRNRRRRSRSRIRRSRTRSRSRSDRNRSYRRRRSSSSSSISSSSSSRSSSNSSSSSSSVSRKSKKSNQSKSPELPQPVTKPASPPKLVSRYYGRKKSDQSSSSELSDSEERDIQMDTADSPGKNEKSSGYGNNSGIVIKKNPEKPMSIQERLKRKRQALLNKQFKADKIAEQLKTERERQEQQHRDDELREMALKFRRRQREKRHAYDSNKSSSSSSDSYSSERESVSPAKDDKRKSLSPYTRRSAHRRSKSRSRSRSKEKSARSSNKKADDRIVFIAEAEDRRKKEDYDRHSRRDNYEKKRDKDREKKDRDRKERSVHSLVDY